MKQDSFKTVVVLVVFIASLGVLFGGYHLYSTYTITNPIKQQLCSRSAVTGVEIAKKGGQYEVAVGLAGVENLQEEYLAITSVLDDAIKKGGYQLILPDHPGQVLGQAYLDLQPAIFEAVASHRFVWLSEILDEYALETGISCHLYVDDCCLYLHLDDGADSLYRVIKLEDSRKLT